MISGYWNTLQQTLKSGCEKEEKKRLCQCVFYLFHSTKQWPQNVAGKEQMHRDAKRNYWIILLLNELHVVPIAQGEKRSILIKWLNIYNLFGESHRINFYFFFFEKWSSLGNRLSLLMYKVLIEKGYILWKESTSHEIICLVKTMFFHWEAVLVRKTDQCSYDISWHVHSVLTFIPPSLRTEMHPLKSLWVFSYT